MTLASRILEVLQSATAPITADCIADIIYGDDPGGGPITAGNIVRCAIYDLRAAGHLIATRKGRHGGYTYHGLRDGKTKPPTPFALHVAARRERVAAMRAAGMRTAQIAKAVGVTHVTVLGDLRRQGVTGRPARIPAKVIDALRAADGPIRAVEIAGQVYADDPEGGPLAATEVVWATVRDLKRAGHRIRTLPGKAGGYVYEGVVA